MNIPFRKIDDGKVKGVLIDATGLKAMYKTLLEKHDMGLDKAEIKGYSELLSLIDQEYEQHFGDKL